MKREANPGKPTISSPLNERERHQSQELGINPEIVQQESSFISMSRSPKNCDNPTRFRETESHESRFKIDRVPGGGVTGWSKTAREARST